MADKLEPLAVGAAEAARLLGVSKPTIYHRQRGLSLVQAGQSHADFC